MRKAETLKQSIDIITGQREEDYGDAHKNFSNVAGLWSIVLGTKVQPWQVAVMLLQLKVARIIKTPTHDDSWIDAAGYIGLGAELATEKMADWELYGCQLDETSGDFAVGDSVSTMDEYDALPVGTLVTLGDGNPLLRKSGPTHWVVHKSSTPFPRLSLPGFKRAIVHLPEA